MEPPPDYYLGYDKRYKKVYSLGAEEWEESFPNEHLVELVEKGLLSLEAQVIDLGCGEGRDSLFLAQQGIKKVVGVDISPGAIEKARQDALSLGLDNIIFKVQDIVYLEQEKNDSHDFALNLGCLHLLVKQEHRDRHLKRVYEILKLQGYFYLINCCRDWGKGFRTIDWNKVKGPLEPGNLIPRKIWTKEGEKEILLEVVYHKIVKKEAHLKELEKAGFRIEKFEETYTQAFGDAYAVLVRKL